MQFEIQKPTRICKTCGKCFYLDAFGTTKTGRIKYRCIPCEDEVVKKRKQEWIKYQKVRRSERMNEFLRSKSTHLTVEINSTNENIDLCKIKSMVLNFNE